MQRFRKQKRRRYYQSGLQRFPRLSDKLIGAHFKYFQIKTNVEAARESHDLNMDFRSFDNGFKQLCVMRNLFEHEAERPSAQTTPKGPSNN